MVIAVAAQGSSPLSCRVAAGVWLELRGGDRGGEWTGIKAEFCEEVGVSKKTGHLFCLLVTDAQRKGIKN